MRYTRFAHSFASTAMDLAKLVPAFHNAGLLSTEGSVKAAVRLPEVLARYRFTTAREVEQGYNVCPKRIAIIDDAGELTYEQLRNNSHTIACYFLSLGIEDLRVGIMARNSRGIVYPLAAKGYAGAGVYLLNIGSSTEQLVGCINRDGINVLVIDEEFLDRLPEDTGNLHVIVGFRETTAHERATEFTSLDEILHSWARTPQAAKVKLPLFPAHGPVVLMSSGTTGTPKGVVRPEPVIPAVVASLLGHVPWRANMRLQLTASIFHTWGWGCLNIALAGRSTISMHRIFNPAQIMADIESQKLEGMFSSPIFLKEMVDLPGDTSSLKFIISSGHALSPWLVEAVHKRFGKILCNLYGSTEISAAAIAGMDDLVESPTVAGHICVGTDLVILDEQDRPAPRGEIGRIFCANSTTLSGYTDPSTPMNTYGHMVQIGDRGFLDEAGRLHVMGRADDMIIVGGENVFPRSVEEVLEPMPGVKDIFATGVEDSKMFSRVAVWVVRAKDSAGKALDEHKVRDWVLHRLAEHSVPRDVHFVDSLPRNATGKVVKAKLG